MFLFKRGKVWFVGWTSNGVPLKKSTGCSSKIEAARLAPGIIAGTSTTEAVVTEEMFESFLADKRLEGLSPETIKYKEDKLKPLAYLVGSAVSFERLKEYISFRRNPANSKRGKPVSAHSIRKELQLLLEVLRHFELDTPSIPKLEARVEPRRVALTPEQVTILVEKLSPEVRAFLLIAVATSGRRSEVWRWSPSDIDLPNRRILVHSTKTKFRGKGDRYVPIHKRNEFALSAGMALVEGCWPETVKDPTIRPFANLRHAYHAIRKAAISAGIGKICLNDLRRTVPSWLVQAGSPAIHVARLLGHTTTEMVERVYVQLSTQHLEKVFDEL